MGEANCPKNKLEVSTPDDLPRLCAGTRERNHEFVLTKRSPKPIPMGSVAKNSPAMLEACEIINKPNPKSVKVTEKI